jgi:hypothetical protein
MKIHLATSPDPLKFGGDFTAKCGAIIPRAEPVFWFNDRFEPEYLEFMNSLKVCSKCIIEELEGYIYGILSAPQAEAEELEKP